MKAGLVWECVSWRCGKDQFQFEIERGGLFATVKAPAGRSFTLPMVVWEGLLDALQANRATKARTEQLFPVRTGSRWYAGEAEEVAKAFLAGRSIPELAKAHHRTVYSIENQLDKLGLFSKAEKYGPRRAEAGRGFGDDTEGIGVHPLDAPLEREDQNESAGSAEREMSGSAVGIASPLPAR